MQVLSCPDDGIPESERLDIIDMFNTPTIKQPPPPADNFFFGDDWTDNTATLRKWLDGEMVNAIDLLEELAYWLEEFGA